MNPIPISAVVGTRPNFMKMAPILEEIRRHPRFSARLIHTGQHYSAEMSDSFFRDLGMPMPDINLQVGSGSHTAQTAGVMLKLEAEFAEHRPGLVLVVGDVNFTMAASLVAVKSGISVAHVEAGLRSFDRRMPEEINRLVTDAIADYLFASEPAGVTNLRAEGVPPEKIFLVGNVMIDTLLKFRDRAISGGILQRLGLEPGHYAVATLHRPSNVDDPASLAGLVRMLSSLAERLPVVFPVHPRTMARIESTGIPHPGLQLLPPQGYLDFLGLTSQARLVLTDSGGVQEETTILRIPCLTLRENTERPVTIQQGTNQLAGTDPEKVFSMALRILDAPPPASQVPEFWDGRASCRILDVLEELFG